MPEEYDRKIKTQKNLTGWERLSWRVLINLSVHYKTYPFR